MDRYDWELGIDRAFEYPRYGSFLPEAGFDVDVPSMGVPEGIRFDPVYGTPGPYTFEQGESGVDPAKILADAPPVAYHPSMSVERGMGELRRPQALPSATIGEASSLIRSMVRLAQPQPSPDIGQFQPSFGPGPSSEKVKFAPQIGKGSISEMINRLLRWGMDEPTQGQDPSQGATGAQASPAGGEWSTLDGMNAGINNAARMTGVPANLIKAMLAREGSFGRDWGRAPVWIAGRTSPVLPFNGIFEETARSRGIDFQRMQTDQDYAIWAMGKVLADIKAEQGFTNWVDVAGYYFAGQNYLNYLQTGVNWSDEGDSNIENYLHGPTGVITRMNYLDGLGGGAGSPAGPTSGSAGGVFSSALWGNVPANISYEYQAESVNGDMYNYGSAHGTNGWVHPGIDVAVPHGTTLFTPRAGTVSCVGTADAGIGGTGGGSCGHFGDTDTGGVGNVTIKFDDGTFLIFGHSQSAMVRPGQRVSAGQAIAKSGGMGGAHVHFEYRVPGGCQSEYCVSDPRQVIPLSSGGSQPTTPGSTRTSGSLASRLWWY